MVGSTAEATHRKNYFNLPQLRMYQNMCFRTALASQNFPHNEMARRRSPGVVESEEREKT
jgi:hypothetical protein